MAKPSRPRAFFFDFGGTLYSYRNKGLGVGGVLRGLLERLGQPPDGVRDRTRVREAYQAASRAAYRAHLNREFYLHRDLFIDTYRRFAIEVVNREPSADLLLWCHEEQRRLVLENFRLREDCVNTLRALREAGFHLAIVSNIDDDYLTPMVERVGLHELLDAWTSSEEATSCKPHEGIFRLALDKAQCDPSAVVFVGDALEADVAGANPLGMTSVYMREPGMAGPTVGSAQPAHMISALKELLAIAL